MKSQQTVKTASKSKHFTLMFCQKSTFLLTLSNAYIIVSFIPHSLTFLHSPWTRHPHSQRLSRTTVQSQWRNFRVRRKRPFSGFVWLSGVTRWFTDCLLLEATPTFDGADLKRRNSVSLPRPHSIPRPWRPDIPY